jgi:hypothetical protein
MIKKITYSFLVCLLLIVLVHPASLCQELTAEELEVYYAVIDIEIWAYFDKEMSGELAAVLIDDIAYEYGVSVETLGDIMERGVAGGVTQREQSIADDISGKIVALQQPLIIEVIHRIFKEAAQQYGISFDEAQDIFYRALAATHR